MPESPLIGAEPTSLGCEYDGRTVALRPTKHIDAESIPRVPLDVIEPHDQRAPAPRQQRRSKQRLDAVTVAGHDNPTCAKVVRGESFEQMRVSPDRASPDSITNRGHPPSPDQSAPGPRRSDSASRGTYRHSTAPGSTSRSMFNCCAERSAGSVRAPVGERRETSACSLTKARTDRLG